MKQSTKALLEKGKVYKQVCREPYAWPGGYEICLSIDGAVLCWRCAKERMREELWFAKSIQSGIVWEGEMLCEHCSHNVATYEECSCPRCEEE